MKIHLEVRGRLLDGSWDCPDNLHPQQLRVDLTENSGTCPDRQQPKGFEFNLHSNQQPDKGDNYAKPT
jgi:hypothetical protein